MCSYLLVLSKFRIDKSNLVNANKKIINRGPDKTNFQSKKFNDLYLYYFHNLLDISGKSILQPLQDDQKIMFFNGEIYYPRKENLADTNLLFNNINKRNFSDFIRKVSGEFAITYIDKIKNEINIFTDLIGTKPIYFALKSGAIAISSYGSSLEVLGFSGIEQVQPNTHLKISLKKFGTFKTIREKIYNMSLEQKVDNFEAWNKSFLNSLKNRVLHFNSKIFVPLSSGYDSGAICAGLNKLNIPYITISIGNLENMEIMRERIKFNKLASCQKHYQLPPINKKESLAVSKLIIQKLGYILFDHIDEPKSYPAMLNEDAGAIALYKICDFMKELGFNSLLSGSGADEIYSDYGFAGEKICTHSEFGGLFPNSLEEIFPWKKFYFDSQRSYLKKDEMITGLFGIEGRYPFLDSELTQEFLSITPKLKNSKYKNCIANFLDIENYPYEENIKIGFGANKLSKMVYIKKKIKKIIRLIS